MLVLRLGERQYLVTMGLMQRGEIPPAGEGYVSKLFNIADRIQHEPGLRFLAVGLLALEAYVGAIGVGGVMTKNREAAQAESTCEEIDVACLTTEANLDVPVAAPPVADLQVTAETAIPPVTEAPTTTTPPPPPPPPPTTTPPPPPPPAAPQGGLSLEISLSAPGKTPQELPPRQLPYEAFVNNQQPMLANIPNLDRLNQLFPNSPMVQRIAEQKHRIAELNIAVTPTVEEYRAFGIDTSRNRAFTDSPSYYKTITPRAFIVHWTGKGYDNVDHFIQSLKPYRVEFFIDKHAGTYQLFESDHNFPAHALSVNEFTQGVEIETGEYDGVNSPLFAYTPDQLEKTVYLAVHFLRRNGLPVDATTILGHYTADLIFSNPYYDPMSGNFLQQRLRKFDPPQELMNVLVNKAQALDAALGPR